jgi:hypothetical protein
MGKHFPKLPTLATHSEDFETVFFRWYGWDSGENLTGLDEFKDSIRRCHGVFFVRMDD